MTMTQKTTTTKTNRKRPQVQPTKLDPNCFQHEILELVSNQRSASKKIQYLQEYRNNALVSIFIWNFDDSVVSLLPPGEVPYADIKEMSSVGGTLSDSVNRQLSGQGKSVGYNGVDGDVRQGRTSLRNEYDKLYNFVKNGNKTLSSIRRETMFINMLQGLHPSEAELLCLVKDKKLTDKYKVTWQNVKDAYPDIRWGGRS